MEVIHFETNGEVGINLSGEYLPNGDLRLIRTFQTADPTKILKPEISVIRKKELKSFRQFIWNKH